MVRATELNKENIYVFLIGAILCYKLGSFALLQIRTNVVTNWATSLLQIRPSVVTNWGSYYKLGLSLLQNRAAITKSGRYYKLGHLLQIRA